MGAAGLDSSSARVTVGRYVPESIAAIRSGRTMPPGMAPSFRGYGRTGAGDDCHVRFTPSVT
jgi:hypothetical protein